MRLSYRVLRLFGIDIRVHLSFVLIVAYFAFVWGGLQAPGGLLGALYGIGLVLMLFVLVLIHELAHSRVAQHYGVKVKSITLLPIGGAASMDEIPEEPRKELLISVAGPLSNMVIAMVMLAISPLVVDWGALDWGTFSSAVMERSGRGFYLYMLFANLLLAAFNLIPAFPLDGGRVFRALVAIRWGRVRATRTASVVGQILALILGLIGVFGGGVILILVAIFVFFGAQAEASQDDLRKVLGALKVKQAVTTDIHAARPSQTLGELAARLFHTYQTDFPVVSGRGELVGLLTRDRLIAMLGEHGPDLPVVEAMRTDYPVAGLEDSVYETMARMRTAHFKTIPVVEDGRLAGMLSMEDISEVYALLSAAGADLLGNVLAAGPRRPGRTGTAP